MKKISTEQAPKAIGPYSQAIVTGNMVYTSGQIALDPATGALTGETTAEQTETAVDGEMSTIAAGEFMTEISQGELIPGEYPETAETETSEPDTAETDATTDTTDTTEDTSEWPETDMGEPAWEGEMP